MHGALDVICDPTVSVSSKLVQRVVKIFEFITVELYLPSDEFYSLVIVGYVFFHKLNTCNNPFDGEFCFFEDWVLLYLGLFGCAFSADDWLAELAILFFKEYITMLKRSSAALELCKLVRVFRNGSIKKVKFFNKALQDISDNCPDLTV